jgi:hypothetical protein
MCAERTSAKVVVALALELEGGIGDGLVWWWLFVCTSTHSYCIKQIALQ